LREPEIAAGADVAAMMQRVASNGFVRNKLTVLHGGANGTWGNRAAAAVRSDTSGATAVTTAGADRPLFDGILAVAATATIEAAGDERESRLEQIRTARMKGYEGDSCGECGNFTLVRNGTCLKCNTCGSTSGCS
jgi:ribonucleoside-diphosphate reductase alpha chain